MARRTSLRLGTGERRPGDTGINKHIEHGIWKEYNTR